jgi:hypothetical protein
VTKALTTAAQAELGQQRPMITVPFDEQELHFHYPKPAQIALMSASTSEFASDDDAVSTFISLFFALTYDAETSRYLRKRMFDPVDEFDVPDIMNIFKEIVAEAAARPTEPSPASLPSRTTSGPSSTAPARRKASRSSRSASTPSATSSTRGSSATPKTEAS